MQRALLAISSAFLGNKILSPCQCKPGKGLENRLKGTGVTPSYRSWYENDCFVSIAAGTFQEDTWSAMKWFSVNVCSESAEIMESE